MKKNIIFNADDFGMNTYVNDAIIDGHVNGIITSTSLVASGDAYKEAIKIAKLYPKLGVGIHSTLVGGLKPLSNPKDVPSLLNENGVFFDSHVDFIKRVYSKQINFTEVYNELDLQFKKILSSNLNVTHVDGHQHLHVLPEVLPIILSLMKKYKLNKMRIPKESYLFFNKNYSLSRIIGKFGLSFISHKAHKSSKQLWIASPRYFWGMMNGGDMTESNVIKIIKEAKKYIGTHEVMIHPGTSNKALNEMYHWNYHWEEELAAMKSDKVKQSLVQAGFNLINYGDLT